MTGLNVKSVSAVTVKMFDFSNVWKVFFLVFSYVFQYLFKTPTNFVTIITPIILISLIDTVTGYAWAIKSKQLCSEKNSKVLVKAFSFSAYILMARVIDAEIGSFAILGYSLPTDWATVTFKMIIVSNESLSILENVAKLGFPIPERIKATLSAFSNDGKRNLEDTGLLKANSVLPKENL